MLCLAASQHCLISCVTVCLHWSPYPFCFLFQPWSFYSVIAISNFPLSFKVGNIERQQCPSKKIHIPVPLTPPEKGDWGGKGQMHVPSMHYFSTISLLMVSAPVPGQAKIILLKSFLYKLLLHNSFGQTSSHFPKACLPGMA